MLRLGLVWKLFRRAAHLQKKRMAMTVAAIAWGTLSIVLLLSFGEGLKRNFARGSRGLGEGIVVVWPAQSRVTPPDVTFQVPTKRSRELVPASAAGCGWVAAPVPAVPPVADGPGVGVPSDPAAPPAGPPDPAGAMEPLEPAAGYSPDPPGPSSLAPQPTRISPSNTAIVILRVVM